MSFGSSAAPISPPPLPDPAPSAPTYASGSGRTANVPGQSSTIMTSPTGVTAPANTQRRSLLGVSGSLG